MNLGQAIREFRSRVIESSAATLQGIPEALSVLVAEIDRAISSQLTEILHHPEFVRLESTWRGLHYVVDANGRHENMQIMLLSISKQELQHDLAGETHALTETKLWWLLVTGVFTRTRAAPFTFVVADYYWDNGDAATLEALAKVGRAATAPIVTGFSVAAALEIAGSDLRGPSPSGIPAMSEDRRWEALKTTEDARYLVLTLPRLRGRSLYRLVLRGTNGTEFVEERHDDHTVWINAAHALGANIIRSVQRYGHCARIRGTHSGGRVEGLTMATRAFGPRDPLSPVEIALADREDFVLSKHGFCPISFEGGGAVFLSAGSFRRVDRTGQALEEAVQDGLFATLPFLLEWCRWAQNLRCMLRDLQRDDGVKADELAQYLQSWIAGYADPVAVVWMGHGSHALRQASVEIQPAFDERPARLIVALTPGWMEWEFGPIALTVDLQPWELPATTRRPVA